MNGKFMEDFEASLFLNKMEPCYFIRACKVARNKTKINLL